MSDSINPANENICQVEFEKKEYAIVGDAFFTRIEGDAPAWLLNVVKEEVASLNNDTYSDLVNYNKNLLDAIDKLDVAKNIYDQYLNKSISDTDAFVSLITTLNSTIEDNEATIINLLSSYATKDYATSTTGGLIKASIENGEIGSKIGELQTAIATVNGTTSQKLSVLESTFNSTEYNVEVNSSAVERLVTYTGYGIDNGLPAVIANSNFYRQLDAYLQGSGYENGGSSTLIQDITTKATEEATRVESKFAYDSTITIRNVLYKAGFGLVQTGTVAGYQGTAPIYDSEFWINANKFKFTNDSKSGAKAPFSIDASGAVPEIYFNGIVSFNNIAGKDDIVQKSEVYVPGTTLINGGKIKTDTIIIGNNNVHISSNGVYIRDEQGRLRVKLGNLNWQPW